MEHADPSNPSIPNSEFLSQLSVAAPKGTAIWVTSFVGHPDLTDAMNWSGKEYRAAVMSAQVNKWTDQNAYYSVAALTRNADGATRRRKANFSRLLVLVADDVHLDDIVGQVTYILETSPGKHQVGIFIDHSDQDATNADLVDRLVTTMAERGMLRADTSGNNSVRYVRLPLGQNQKPRESGHFSTRLLRWNPDVRLSLDDAAAAFQVNLDDCRHAVSKAVESGDIGNQGDLLRLNLANIVRGERLHESINETAASLAASGVPGGSIVNLLRGAMEASTTAKDERWLARFSDIPRSVSTAEEKYKRNPVHISLGQSQTTESLLLSLDELQAKASTVAWQVKHVVPSNALGMLFGASGTFKSFIALDHALHVAHGLPWMGKRTNQGPVVYIAAEGGAGISRRITAWHKHRGLKTPENFYVCVTPLVLNIDAQIASITRAIAALPVRPALVYVDTMSQTFVGDENSNTDIASYLRGLNSAVRARFACTVVVVHHTGHNATERPRGASSIIGNVDFLIGCYKPEASSFSARLDVSKQKDDDKLVNLAFRLHRIVLGHDEDGDEVSSLACEYSDQVQQMIKTSVEKLKGHEQEVFDLLKSAGGSMLEFDLRHEFYNFIGREAQKLGKPYVQDTAKKAFSRAISNMSEKGVISIGVNKIIRLLEQPSDHEEGAQA